MEREPPFIMLSVASYHVFSAGVIIAIFVRVDPNSSSVPYLRHSVQVALASLQSIASNYRLGNVAEQAQRYWAALSEMTEHAGGQRPPPEVVAAGDKGESSQSNAAAAEDTSAAQQQQQQQSEAEINTSNLELLGRLANASSTSQADDALEQLINQGAGGGNNDDTDEVAQQKLAETLRELETAGERTVPGANYNYAPGPTAGGATGVSASANIDPSLDALSASASAAAPAQAQAEASPAAASDFSAGELAQNWSGWERWIDSILDIPDFMGPVPMEM